MRALSVRGWGTLAALLVFAAVVVATAVTIVGRAPAPRRPTPAEAALASDVDRCSHLGQAAESDPACRDAWRASRERFLGSRAHREQVGAAPR